MSFFFCKVVVAKPAVKWKWFLLTGKRHRRWRPPSPQARPRGGELSRAVCADTLERLMAVSRVIVDAQWMNILALRQVCTAVQPGLSRQCEAGGERVHHRLRCLSVCAARQARRVSCFYTISTATSGCLGCFWLSSWRAGFSPRSQGTMSSEEVRTFSHAE